MEYLLVVLLTDQKALSKYDIERPKCVLIISGKLLAQILKLANRNEQITYNWQLKMIYQENYMTNISFF